MFPLISVIIPIYNVADYLDACIDSIFNQSYPNLEIILIDDGSTDNSAHMCDQYALQDSRVVVIHQSNGGRSVARNSGLDRAKGDYIAFVDSDDMVSTDFINKLFNILNHHNADISICDFQLFSGEVPSLHNGPMQVELFGTEFIEKLYTKGWRMKTDCVWNKLYKKTIFEKLRFPKDLVHEDAYIFQDIFNKSNNYKIAYSPLKLYYYRQDVPNSIMSYSDFMPERFYSSVALHQRRITTFKAKGYRTLLKRAERSQGSLYIRSVLNNKNIKFIKSELKRDKKILCTILFVNGGFRSKVIFLKKLLSNG